MRHEETDIQTISRRKFIVNTGGITLGVMVAGWLPACTDVAGRPVDTTDYAPDGSETPISAWIRIHPDGHVTIYNPAAEMGQGSMTALAVIIAEELDADWSLVHIEHAPIEPETYGLSWGGTIGGSMLTVGSRTVRGYFNGLRIAGAQARRILLDNAARHWGVPTEELTTGPGVVHHVASERKLTYGEIAAFATVPEEAPAMTIDQLKPASEFRLIGKVDVPRYDIPAKVDGTAQFSADVLLPGMVYGVINRTPVHGGSPVEWNDKEIRSMTGVLEVVRLHHGVGVVAESVEQCLAAKNALQIQWDNDVPMASHNSASAWEEYALVADRMQGHAGQGAHRTYTADYKNDYCYHAQMEPLNAVVSVAEDGKSAEAWVGSQAPDTAREAVARVLGLQVKDVILHPCYLGGGFGRRSMDDFVTEAAHLAKEVRRPVKLLWTREDDVRYGAFRPMSLQRLQASVDASGNIAYWDYRIVGPGDRLLASGAEADYYALGKHRVQVEAIVHGIRTKHWRAVGHGPNKYAIESFIDEIAAGLGRDPVEYRLQLMQNDPGAQAVLRAVAELSGWGGDVPEGRARGVAFIERSGSLVAGVCELSCDTSSGKISVHRVWLAVDAGIVVQKDNAIAQLEGAVIMGLSSVLLESISVRDGVVEQSNFHDYQLLRISDAPESIDVAFIASDAPPTGIGEASLPVVGGAVANAFAALTGKRLRHMPFTPERVKEVLEA